MSLATTHDLAEPLDRVSRAGRLTLRALVDASGLPHDERADRDGRLPSCVPRQLELTHPTSREVAERLFVSPHTVNSHLRPVFAKLGIDSRVELARLARDHELA